jgi:hypothetical protein
MSDKDDRRAAQRHRCGPPILVLLHLNRTLANLWSLAHDLSATGIGLHLPHPLQTHDPIFVHLRGWLPAPSTLHLRHTLDIGDHVILHLWRWLPEPPITTSARVIYATEYQDYTWRVGCAFESQLDPETLKKLLWPLV